MPANKKAAQQHPKPQPDQEAPPTPRPKAGAAPPPRASAAAEPPDDTARQHADQEPFENPDVDDAEATGGVRRTRRVINRRTVEEEITETVVEDLPAAYGLPTSAYPATVG